MPDLSRQSIGFRVQRKPEINRSCGKNLLREKRQGLSKILTIQRFVRESPYAAPQVGKAMPSPIHCALQINACARILPKLSFSCLQLKGDCGQGLRDSVVNVSGHSAALPFERQFMPECFFPLLPTHICKRGYRPENSALGIHYWGSAKQNVGSCAVPPKQPKFFGWKGFTSKGSHERPFFQRNAAAVQILEDAPSILGKIQRSAFRVPAGQLSGVSIGQHDQPTGVANHNSAPYLEQNFLQGHA